VKLADFDLARGQRFRAAPDLAQTTMETRGVPNLFCASCRKGSGFDFARGPIFWRHTGVRFS